MSVTIDELRATEEILTKYFKDIRVLNIWKASAKNRREHKNRLESRIEDGILVSYIDNVKSPMLSHAQPSNRQPSKGLDACIDKAEEVYDNLLVELQTTEFDIITTEKTINKLEQDTFVVSEVMKTIKSESIRVLELKLDQNKSFEDIGDIINKSKTAVRAFYKKSMYDICRWFKYIGILDEKNNSPKVVQDIPENSPNVARK